MIKYDEEACSVSEGVERLSRGDSTLKHINFYSTQYTDSELAELADCLLAHPDIVTRVLLGRGRLTDETGAKLARYLAASSTIEWLSLSFNQFGLATYLAVAAALRANSSLQVLYLYGNREVKQIRNQIRIDAAFVEALWLNPIRPTQSRWFLYSFGVSDIDFSRLKSAADAFRAPSMLSQLRHCDRTRTKTKIREICFFFNNKKNV